MHGGRIAREVGARAGMAWIVGAAVLLLAAPSLRQAPADRCIVKDVMIPARDGVKLHTKISTPKDQSGPLPIIMKCTPYGVEGSDLASPAARGGRCMTNVPSEPHSMVS